MIEVFVLGNLISTYFFSKYIKTKISATGKFERKEFILANIYYFSYTMMILLVSLYVMQLLSYVLMIMKTTESPDSIVQFVMQHTIIAKFMKRFLTNIAKVMANSFAIHGAVTVLFMIGNNFKPITDEYRVKFEYYLLNTISLITTCVTIFYI
jgi:Cu/Ag efflux pump CusA